MRLSRRLSELPCSRLDVYLSPAALIALSACLSRLYPALLWRVPCLSLGLLL
jgi:hypothetical protein